VEGAVLGDVREHVLDQGLSPRTTNKILTLLHGVFRLAMERGTVARNPVAAARKAKQRKKKLGQYLTAPEVLSLAVEPADLLDGFAG
jgi:site-specific recombinase XerD